METKEKQRLMIRTNSVLSLEGSQSGRVLVVGLEASSEGGGRTGSGNPMTLI